MRIEKLEPSSHRAGRWLVWLEDGSLIRVGEGDVVSLGLYTGKELTEEDAAVLTAAESGYKMNERAVNLLSARSMSKKELVDKLSAPTRRRKKPGEEGEGPSAEALEAERARLRADAETAAARMEELGLVNDESYARDLVRHYAAKGYGQRRLKDELYRRGVPRAYWDEALAGAEMGEDTLDALVRRRLRGEPTTRETLKKTSDFLARRGFGWEEISAALRRYEEAFGAEELTIDD